MSEEHAEPHFTPADSDVLQSEGSRYFTFFNITLALIALTFLELIIIVLPFHPLLLLIKLIVLSVIKFVLVVWYFMHLKWEKLLLPSLFVLGMVIASGTAFVLYFLFPAGEGIVDDNTPGIEKTSY